MVRGFLIALLVAENTPLRRLTRAMVFVPVVIGLGASSLLWYWLFNSDFGPVNRALIDLGLISQADRSGSARTPTARIWAIIVSVIWKVIGFGMLLFVAAIQAIPQRDR